MDVPLNVQPITWHLSVDGYELGLRAVAADQDVPIETETILVDNHWELVQLKPLQPLEPSTEYEVRSFLGVTATFTTGTASDDRQPRPPTLSSIWPQRMHTDHFSCHSSCTTVDRILTDAVLAEENAVHYAKIEGPGDTQWVVLSGGDATLLGSGCNSRIVVRADSEYCVQIFSFGLSGTQAASDRVCATGAHCMGVESTDPQRPCEPTRECSPWPLPEPEQDGDGCAASRQHDTPVAWWALPLAVLGLLRTRARLRGANSPTPRRG